jgi:hypothetical protein
MSSVTDINKIIRLFKNIEDLALTKVKVRGPIRYKEHSRFNIILADEMFLSSQDWNNRIHIKDYQ